jgi:hypothetical protein
MIGLIKMFEFKNDLVVFLNDQSDAQCSCGRTFQDEILFGSTSVRRSKDRGSAIIFVSHVSGVPECVSLWISLFHQMMINQRVASYQRHSPGVIDHFQLRPLVYGISNKIIISSFHHLLSLDSSAQDLERLQAISRRPRRIRKHIWRSVLDLHAIEQSTLTFFAAIP